MKAGKFITSILLVAIASFLGYLFTNQAVKDWYPTLLKPELNPPSWIFGPVWSVLYLMMGIALYLVRIKPANTGVKIAIVFFYIQLALNVLWSYSFFMLHSPHLGLLNIIVLWVMIIITVFLFFGQSKIAGWLLIPYLLWVSFASYLNFSIWFLN